MVLEVEVSVFFTDAFDNQWNQIFQRILVCRKHNNYFLLERAAHGCAVAVQMTPMNINHAAHKSGKQRI